MLSEMISLPATVVVFAMPTVELLTLRSEYSAVPDSLSRSPSRWPPERTRLLRSCSGKRLIESATVICPPLRSVGAAMSGRSDSFRLPRSWNS